MPSVKIGRKAEGRVGHYRPVTQHVGADPATNTHPPIAGNGEDLARHRNRDIQSSPAREVIPSPIGRKAEGRVGHFQHESHVIDADPATDIGSPIAGNGEDLARQTETEIQGRSASEVTVSKIGRKAEAGSANAALKTIDQTPTRPPTTHPAQPEDGGDHTSHVSQDGLVAPATSSLVGGDAEGRVGQNIYATRSGNADPATIDEIREQWRRRQAWHRAEKALTLQAKALCRRLAEGGDKVEADRIYKAALGKEAHDLADVALAAMLPLVEARDGIARHRKLVERRLADLAKSLPVAPWVEGVRGVGLASLAAIVGEAGDLAVYANPAKLWKRMGLAVMPDGGRQRRIAGEDAIEHGYSPARRSVMWNIGACIIKGGGPLKQAYDARKLYEAERTSTKLHAHRRAQRYIEKRFLRDLWVAWRRLPEAAPAEIADLLGAEMARVAPL